MSNPTAPPELLEGLEETVDDWAKIRLGHQAIMLDRMQRIQRIGEIDARNAMTGKTGDTAGWPIDEEANAMGVNIGDNVVNHYYPQPAEPVTEAEPTKQVEPITEKQVDEAADRKLGSKARLAAKLAAVILGGAAIPAVGVPLASWLGLFDQPSAVEQITDTVRSLEVGKRLPTAEELKR